MEVLGGVASVVGIISLGIQISQILQVQIDDVVHANEKIAKVIVELQTTTSAIEQLIRVLIDDERAAKSRRVFNVSERNAIAHIIQACNGVFRELTTIIAKSGKAVLGKVDAFQRRIKKEQRKATTQSFQSDIKLTIEISKHQHLRWTWRVRKVEQCTVELERHKSNITLHILIASLGKMIKTKADPNDNEPPPYDSDDENTLIDEIYYTDRAHAEAEQKAKDVAHEEATGMSMSPQGNRMRPVTPWGASNIIQNWPYRPGTSKLVSLGEMKRLGIVLEAWSSACNDVGQTWIPILTSSREIYNLATASIKGDNPNKSVMYKFKKLSLLHQTSIETFLRRRALSADHTLTYVEPAEATRRPEFPRMVYLEYRNPARRWASEVLKLLLPVHGVGYRSTEILMITARAPSAEYYDETPGAGAHGPLPVMTRYPNAPPYPDMPTYPDVPPYPGMPRYPNMPNAFPGGPRRPPDMPYDSDSLFSEDDDDDYPHAGGPTTSRPYPPYHSPPNPNYSSAAPYLHRTRSQHRNDKYESGQYGHGQHGSGRYDGPSVIPIPPPPSMDPVFTRSPNPFRHPHHPHHPSQPIPAHQIYARPSDKYTVISPPPPPPTQEEKESVAEDLLRRWTVVFEDKARAVQWAMWPRARFQKPTRSPKPYRPAVVTTGYQERERDRGIPFDRGGPAYREIRRDRGIPTNRGYSADRGYPGIYGVRGARVAGYAQREDLQPRVEDEGESEERDGGEREVQEINRRERELQERNRKDRELQAEKERREVLVRAEKEAERARRRQDALQVVPYGSRSGSRPQVEVQGGGESQIEDERGGEQEVGIERR